MMIPNNIGLAERKPVQVVVRRFAFGEDELEDRNPAAAPAAIPAPASAAAAGGPPPEAFAPEPARPAAPPPDPTVPLCWAHLGRRDEVD